MITPLNNSRDGRDKFGKAARVKALIYFNNDREGFAIKNAKKLMKQLGCADPPSS